MATDIDIPQLTKVQAERLATKIQSSANDLLDLIDEFKAGRGWIALGYDTWKECCQKRFGRDPSWESRQRLAKEERARCQLASDVPESVVRELRKLPEEERADAWKDITERLGDHPTAEQVAHEVDLMLPPDDDPAESPTLPQDASEEEEDAEGEEVEEETPRKHVDDKEPFGEQLWLVVTRFWKNQYPEVPAITVADYLEEIRERVLKGEK